LDVQRTPEEALQLLVYNADAILYSDLWSVCPYAGFRRYPGSFCRKIDQFLFNEFAPRI
jgi:hypothetical protein